MAKKHSQTAIMNRFRRIFGTWNISSRVLPARGNFWKRKNRTRKCKPSRFPNRQILQSFFRENCWDFLSFEENLKIISTKRISVRSSRHAFHLPWKQNKKTVRENCFHKNQCQWLPYPQNQLKVSESLPLEI